MVNIQKLQKKKIPWKLFFFLRVYNNIKGTESVIQILKEENI